MNNDMPPFGRRGFAPMRLDGHHGGPGALGWVIFALQLLMLLALAALLVRAFAGPRFAGPPGGGFGRRKFVRRAGPPGPPDPLTHLRMRYANGDISREEYLEKSHDLDGTPEPEAPTDELAES